MPNYDISFWWTIYRGNKIGVRGNIVLLVPHNPESQFVRCLTNWKFERYQGFWGIFISVFSSLLVIFDGFFDVGFCTKTFFVAVTYIDKCWCIIVFCGYGVQFKRLGIILSTPYPFSYKKPKLFAALQFLFEAFAYQYAAFSKFCSAPIPCSKQNPRVVCAIICPCSADFVYHSTVFFKFFCMPLPNS